MNNKGFTLIELLATIVILALISTVVFISVTDTYNKSKDKAEEAFYEQIGTYMDDYITMGGSKGKTYNLYGSGTYRKYYCIAFDEDGSCIEEKFDEITLKYSNDFKIETIASEVTDDKLVNPKTEVECTNTNTNITVYRDSDSVYCHVIVPAGTNSCINRTISSCVDRYKENVDEGNYIELGIMGE